MQQRSTSWRDRLHSPRAMAMPLSRRQFFGLAGVCTGLAAFHVLPGVSFRGNAGGPAFTTYPFTLGVASGDPGWHSVALWTRLAPDPLHGGGMAHRPVDVRWEVAYDAQMQHVVKHGMVTAHASLGHTIHVTVQGLEPERWYWYRFWAEGVESPLGRTRTLPHPTARPQRLRFALACCQDYQNGYYSAYHNMAQEDLDFVLHVGDYIYEDGPRLGAPRQVPDPEITTLEAYRNRYALYRLDPALQAVHAAFPFIVTWDDHEVANNYAGGSPEQEQSPAAFLARRAAAYQAYYEHMPLRHQAALGAGGIQLFRKFRFGHLAQLHVLDTRQWRTDQPCMDGLQPLCTATESSSATMLGSAQETWLFDCLQSSLATWNVLAQQVMMMQWALGPAVGFDLPRFNMDAWDGYRVARRNLLDFLALAKPTNPIVLSGDIHCNGAGELRTDFDDPRTPHVAVEFVTTAIASDFPLLYVDAVQASLADNPHIRFFEGIRRGYIRCTVDRHLWRTDYRGVRSLLEPIAAIDTIASYVVERGQLTLMPG